MFFFVLRVSVRLLLPSLIAGTLLWTHAAAQDGPDTKEKPLVDVDAQKRGRVAPENNKEGVKPFSSKEGGKAAADEPNVGNILERMGADPGELPPEKPFTGKVDEAFGAYQRGYYLTAMELALPRAQLGDPAAQTLVAELLQNGLGVPRNPKDAAFWYGQASNGEDAAAMLKYALLLLEGKLVPKDEKKAEELMQKAADRGNASAQFNYGQVLVKKMPGERGLKAALPYYEKSAEQGIADAQYAISQIYLNVDGIDENKRAKAREWLLRAARAGFDTAQYDIAVWLIEGIAGERNLDVGFGWMKLAAEGGNVLAQNRLAHLYVNAIGTRPDPVEAAKWYILSRRAGLKDPILEDFYLGIDEATQRSALEAANRFRSS